MSELGDEVRQYLPFDQGSQLEGDPKWYDLRDLLCGSGAGLKIFHNGSQQILSQHDNGKGLDAVLQLSYGNKERKN